VCVCVCGAISECVAHGGGTVRPFVQSIDKCRPPRRRNVFALLASSLTPVPAAQPPCIVSALLALATVLYCIGLPPCTVHRGDAARLGPPLAPACLLSMTTTFIRTGNDSDMTQLLTPLSFSAVVLPCYITHHTLSDYLSTDLIPS